MPRFQTRRCTAAELQQIDERIRAGRITRCPTKTEAADDDDASAQHSADRSPRRYNQQAQAATPHNGEDRPEAEAAAKASFAKNIRSPGRG